MVRAGGLARGLEWLHFLKPQPNWRAQPIVISGLAFREVSRVVYSTQHPFPAQLEDKHRLKRPISPVKLAIPRLEHGEGREGTSYRQGRGLSRGKTSKVTRAGVFTGGVRRGFHR